MFVQSFMFSWVYHPVDCTAPRRAMLCRTSPELQSNPPFLGRYEVVWVT